VIVTATSPPRWRPGDRWVYEFIAGSQTATKTIEVARTEAVAGVTYYVANLGEIQEYFTRDIHWAASVRNSKVEARMVPPQPWYVWPLESGRRWTHRAVFEGPQGQREQVHRFSVIGSEVVEVPAGQFPALKILREADEDQSDQYWYSPQVGSHVRWVGARGQLQFEERLREYAFAERPGSTGLPTALASPR
jgi:hypothetical protein